MSNIIAFSQSHRNAENEADEKGAPVYSLADLGEGAINTKYPKELYISLQDGMSQVFGAENSVTFDWSNQELASLYRAQRLLSLTGVSFDVDRGLSDEGDPWFVFMDDANQVLVHFCRIEGRYCMDSAAQSELLTADSLEALVSNFARRNDVLQVSTSDETAADVIEFRKLSGTSVLMHPGVSLAALIWSVYIFSDDLVIPTWSRDPDGQISEFRSDSEIVPVLAEEVPSGFPLEKPGNNLLVADSGGFSETRETYAFVPALLSGHGANYVLNVIALGLTALSISHGGSRLRALVNIPLTKDAAPQSAAYLAQDEQFRELYSELVKSIGDLHDASSLMPQTAILTDDQGAEGNEVISFLESTISHVMSLLDTFEAAVASLELPGNEPFQMEWVPALYVEEDSQLFLTDTVVDKASVDLTRSVTKLDFFERLLDFDVVDAGELSNVVHVLSLDETPLLLLETAAVDATKMSDVFESSHEAVEVTTYATFGQVAHDFIVYFLQNNENLQRTTYDDELILVDLSVVGGGSGAVYARSWSFDDGSVLSTIGLKSDFELFGLVA